MRFRGLGGNSLNKHAFLILISESPACEVLRSIVTGYFGVLREPCGYCIIRLFHENEALERFACIRAEAVIKAGI